MKKLFLDVDGVLLTKRQPQKADGVLPFIEFVTKNFECYWLTTHCKGDTIHVLSYLSRYFDKSAFNLLQQIKPTNWSTLKTEAIAFDEDFVWLDDSPFDAELAVLKENNAPDRLIIVDLQRQDELARVIALLEKQANVSS